MAALNLFNKFTDDLTAAKHNFDSHVFKVYLTNAAPDAALDSIKTDLAEISAGNGYTAGGATTTITRSNTAGVEKIVASDVAWTATGGAISQFRYVVVYNDTDASDALIGWYDYGSAVTPAVGETFTTDFDGTNGIFTIG